MSVAMPPLRRWAPALVFAYGLVAATFFAFLFYRRQGVVENVVDLNGFGKIALHLAHGDGFSLGAGPTVRRAPLYPFIGAALLLLFGHDEPGPSGFATFWPMLLGNCVAFGFTCVFVMRVASRLYGERVGILAAAICPLVPQCLRYVGMTEVETMTGLWTVMLADTGLSLASRPSLRAGVLFGAAAAAATLTKPVSELYIGAFLAIAAWHWARVKAPRRAAIEGAGAALACFALLLVPWTARNWALTDGHFKGISSNAPGEFLRGYVNVQPKYYLLRQNFGGTEPGEKWDPEANLYELGLYREYGFDPNLARQADGKPAEEGAAKIDAFSEIARDRVEGEEARKRVMQGPFELLRKAFVQVFTFWYVVETRTRSVLVGAIALVVLALAALGVLRARAPGAIAWPVVLLIVYFNALYAVFLAFARYSMPLFPTLSALAAGGIALVVDRVIPRFRLLARSERARSAP